MAQLNCNLHITLTPFRNESRVLRETLTLTRHGLARKVVIAALQEDDLPAEETLDEARSVRRIRLRTRHWPRNLLVQLVKYFELWARLSRLTAETRADAVSIHTLALLPVAAWLKLRFRVRLVYDAHELETETEGLTGIRQRLARLVEGSLIRFADLVIVVAPGIREHYVASYAHPAVVSVLNCPEYRKIAANPRLREELGIPGTATTYLYLGNLSDGRGIEPLINAFEDADPAECALVFVGYGEAAQFVEQRARTSPAIYYRPAVAPNRVLECAAGADVGMCLIEDTCLSYRLCLPNKLFEYTMAGIPVIVSDLPEMTAVVRRYGIGEVAHALDRDAIHAAIGRLAENAPAALRQRLAAAGRELCWESQEQAMLKAYRDYVLRAT